MHKRLLTTVAARALTDSFAGPSQAQQAVPTRDFDVYVDLPTGFAFIKCPSGWKFIRKLDAEQLRDLPPTTLTALIEPDDQPGTVRYAKPAPRTDLDNSEPQG